jgi:hypothetical protein
MSWLVNRLLLWVVDVFDRNLLLGEHDDTTTHAGIPVDATTIR